MQLYVYTHPAFLQGIKGVVQIHSTTQTKYKYIFGIILNLNFKHGTPIRRAVRSYFCCVFSRFISGFMSAKDAWNTRMSDASVEDLHKSGQLSQSPSNPNIGIAVCESFDFAGCRKCWVFYRRERICGETPT